MRGERRLALAQYCMPSGAPLWKKFLPVFPPSLPPSLPAVQLFWFSTSTVSSSSARTVPRQSTMPSSCSATSFPSLAPSSQTAVWENIGRFSRSLFCMLWATCWSQSRPFHSTWRLICERADLPVLYTGSACTCTCMCQPSVEWCFVKCCFSRCPLNCLWKYTLYVFTNSDFCVVLG